MAHPEDSPYRAPNEAPEAQSLLLFECFQPFGLFDRRRFGAALSMIWGVFFVVTMALGVSLDPDRPAPTAARVIYGLLTLLLTVMTTIAGVRRARHAEFPIGLFTLGLMVPLLNVFFAAMLLFLPGRSLGAERLQKSVGKLGPSGRPRSNMSEEDRALLQAELDLHGKDED